MEQKDFMRKAIGLSIENVKNGGGPFGAVIVKDGEIIATGTNRVTANNDPTAHAEVSAIREACRRLNQNRLRDLDIYVTLEPCTMCAAAISFARIKHLYFGAYDTKGGAVTNGIRFYEQPTCHHRPQVYGGILESDCAAILKDFFRKKRRQAKG